MPFKSEAQRRFLEANAKRLHINIEHWEAATPKGKRLPARVTTHHPPKSVPKTIRGAKGH
jgi:hypothetical protein